MRRRLPGVGVSLGLIVLVLALGNRHSSALLSGQASLLRIVVIAGEDAVNVVQQKTAVAPVIEVRDQNDQPVAGAVVRFAIRNGRASFGGARNLTVATNAAGRAVATGLTPTGSGALQIGATASFQGQSAALTIAQTNVMTASQAAAAGASSAGGGGAGGAGGGAGGSTAGAGGGAGGGGLSTTTLAIVGAAAGGAVAVKEVVLGGQHQTVYVGPYSNVMTLRFAGAGACTISYQISGTLRFEMHAESDGSMQGNVQNAGRREFLSSTCFPPDPTIDYGWGNAPGNITGTTSDVRFLVTPTFTDGLTAIWDFKGVLNGNVVTGTLDHTAIQNGFTNGVVQFSVTATAQGEVF